MPVRLNETRKKSFINATWDHAEKCTCTHARVHNLVNAQKCLLYVLVRLVDLHSDASRAVIQCDDDEDDARLVFITDQEKDDKKREKKKRGVRSTSIFKFFLFGAIIN